VRFECSHARNHKEKKVLDPFKQRNASSKRINCGFHINVRSPKNIAPHWHITTVVENHNHELHPGAASFGRDVLKLDPEMVAKIQLYSKADIGLRKVLILLKEEWTDRHFVARQVANALLKAKREAGQPDVPQVVQLLGLLHDNQREDGRWFIRKDIDEDSGRLQRLFWMNPVQRELYLRYRDVVLNDSTAQTNRFNMPLNTFVVVDTNGKSRMVGCALISSETTDDYEWILRSLLEAGEGLAPAVIIVDEDPAMEAACAAVIPETAIVNCIWHLASLNLPKNLRGALGASWDEFIARFWIARNALTTDEFQRRWSAIVRDFGNRGPKTEAYLGRLFGRRAHWAWPWVRTHFTAGIQSTQRVEKTHDIIKRSVGKMTPLKDLFGAIEQKISDERSTAEYFNYKEAMRPVKAQSDFAANVFAEVDEINRRFLGQFALFQMRREIAQSLFYRSQEHKLPRDGVEIDANGNLNDGAVCFALFFSRFPISFRFNTNALSLFNLLQIESTDRQESRKASLNTLLSLIDNGNIQTTFDVAFLLAPDHPQYVILLRDGSYLCTCLLLQNSGIVCRHFFHLMQVDKKCKYHISLVRRRWYKELAQDDPNTDVREEPFLFARTQHQALDSTDTMSVPDIYMADILGLFPSLPAVSESDKLNISKKKRFGVLTGMSKELAEMASSNQEAFEKLKSMLAREIRGLKGDDDIEDPQQIKTKGRPKKSRFVSSVESQKGRSSVKCGRCGGEGHNSRTCHGG
jgi:hypothetical protein